MSIEHWCDDDDKGEKKVKQKPAPGPHRPTNILHGLARDQTPVSPETDWRLIA